MSAVPSFAALDIAWAWMKTYPRLAQAQLDFKQGFFSEEEAYKYQVYDEARRSLGIARWRDKMLGTGEIYKAAVAAIRTPGNNLLDWRKVSHFQIEHRAKSDEIEDTLWTIYKGGDSQETLKQGYDQLIGITDYQTTAFFFFLKDQNQYLPISQDVFDKAFAFLGLDFKTSFSASWDNYRRFIAIHKQVKAWLQQQKAINNRSALQDAHSFVYWLGVLVRDGHPVPSIDNTPNFSSIPSVLEETNAEDTNIPPYPIAGSIEETDDLDQFKEVLGEEEGKAYYAAHRRYERSMDLVKQVKALACVRGNGRIVCEACGFCFLDLYGSLGDRFIECHHNIPIASKSGLPRFTGPEELSLLCSNCHRMIHRARPMLTVQELREIIGRNGN